MTLNEGRSVSSGDTPDRRVTAAPPGCALNEGRSVSSGDTAAAKATLGGGWDAQRRPER